MKALSLVALLLMTGCHNPERASKTRCTPWTPPCPEIYFPAKVPLPPPCEAELPNIKEILSIDQLMDLALSYNPSTQRAWWNARSFVFGMRISESTLYPTINARGTTSLLSQFNSRSPSNSTYFRTYEQLFTASYLMWDFGGRAGTIEASRQALIAANWVHARTIQDVLIAVMQTYYNHIGVKATLEARLADLKNAETGLEVAEALYKAGVRPKLDFLLAESNVWNVRLDVESLTGRERTSLGLLTTTVGLPADSNLKVLPLPETLPVKNVSEDVEELIAIANKNRTDLAASYAILLQQESNVRAAYSGLMPTVNSFTSLSETTFIGGHLSKSHTNSTGISIAIPLFDGFLARNTVKQAKARAQIALYDLQARQNAVVFDVWASYYALQTAKQSLVSSAEFLKVSQEAYDSSLAQYKQGTASILDMLLAQGALSNAKAQEIQSKTAWLSALASLAYSIGIMEGSNG